METTSRNTVLRVSGMTCGSCVRHVQSALAGLGGVRNVDVRLREGKVIVEQQGDGAPVSAMIEALDEAGYDAALEPSDARPAAPRAASGAL